MGLNHRQTDPPRAQHPPEMPVGKQRDVSDHCPDPRQHPIGPGGDLGRRLALRAAIAKQIPVRPGRENVRPASRLIVAIVPFRQVRADFGSRAESGECARPSCPLPGTREHMGQRELLQPWAQFPRRVLPGPSELNVGDTRVLAGLRPEGFPVTNEINFLQHSLRRAAGRPGGRLGARDARIALAGSG